MSTIFKRRQLLKGLTAFCSAVLFSGCRDRGEKDAKDENPSLARESADPEGAIQDFLDRMETNDPGLRSAESDLKQRARNDYATSFAQFGGLLSNSDEELQGTYDVVVIGSGYGASITAARIGEAYSGKKSVAVFERGAEWIPGSFPDSLKDFRKNLRSKTNTLGLYDISSHDDLYVLAGSGLGGTSLVNANVAVRPDPAIFTTSRWPAALQNSAALESYYLRVERELSVAPTAPNSSPKIFAQQQTSVAMGANAFIPLNIAVTQGNDKNQTILSQAGIKQRSCTFCGDCLTGCNVGAKNTLPYNYLAKAKKAGVKIFTGKDVRLVEKLNDGTYRIHIRNSDRSLSSLRGFLKRLFKPWSVDADFSIQAKAVVVGAGALGSTGILLRSRRSAGLSTSSRLGEGYSSNGDSFSMVRDIDTDKLGFAVSAVGKGAYSATNNVGPTIQSAQQYLTDSQILIEDLSIPRALTSLFKPVVGDEKRALFLLGIGHDASNGRIELNLLQEPTIKWPRANDQVIYNKIRSLFDAYAVRVFGRSSAIFRWGESRKHVTAHPLGGCGMGNSGQLGVVDSFGRVFAGEGTQTHFGLYVVDGAIVPSSVGANPFLTISALAERASEAIISDIRF